MASVLMGCRIEVLEDAEVSFVLAQRKVRSEDRKEGGSIYGRDTREAGAIMPYQFYSVQSARIKASCRLAACPFPSSSDVASRIPYQSRDVYRPLCGMSFAQIGGDLQARKAVIPPSTLGGVSAERHRLAHSVRRGARCLLGSTATVHSCGKENDWRCWLSYSQ